MADKSRAGLREQARALCGKMGIHRAKLKASYADCPYCENIAAALLRAHRAGMEAAAGIAEECSKGGIVPNN